MFDHVEVEWSVGHEFAFLLEHYKPRNSIPCYNQISPRLLKYSRTQNESSKNSNNYQFDVYLNGQDDFHGIKMILSVLFPARRS